MVRNRIPWPFRIVMIAFMTAAVVRGQATPLPLPATQPAATHAASSDFLRFVDHGKLGGKLETADVVYRNAAGARVSLVSAVHIGEKDYYQGLNKAFADYDAVLYELVKQKDAPVPQPVQPGEGPRKSDHAIAQFQRILNEALGLEYQLDQIDYTRANFVHADLDAETFQKMQAERGENFATIMLRSMMQAMSRPPNAAEAPEQMLGDLIGMVTRPDAERQMRLLMARQLGRMEEQALGLDGPNGSVIITERNKAALLVMDATIKAGKKNIAIFYGAAHMPDMAKRLSERGFNKVETHWRTAWDVTIRRDQPSMIEGLLNDLFLH